MKEKLRKLFEDYVFGCFAKNTENGILLYLRDDTCRCLRCSQKELNCSKRNTAVKPAAVNPTETQELDILFQVLNATSFNFVASRQGY